VLRSLVGNEICQILRDHHGAVVVRDNNIVRKNRTAATPDRFIPTHKRQLVDRGGCSNARARAKRAFLPGTSSPDGPSFLEAGFGTVEQVLYDAANPANQPVIWSTSNGKAFGHRVIEDSDQNIIGSEGFYFDKIDRVTKKELWRRQDKNAGGVVVEWRGVAEDPLSGAYFAADLTDNWIDVLDRNTGAIISHFGVYNIGDGGPIDFMKFPYGIRVIDWPY